MAQSMPTNHVPKILLDARARYEYGDFENKEDSYAATLRVRAGLESQSYYGFSGLIEFEATRAGDRDSYWVPNVQGDPKKSPIADPETTEINRAQVQYKNDGNQAILGRQRIILDNQRFVGNVGWRQNEQTFDAMSYKNTMIKDTALYYAYIDEVQRIFGSDAPDNGPSAESFESDSHLINASYTGLKGSTFTGYSYLLDFDNSPGNSCDTFGGSYGYKSSTNSDIKVEALLDAAYQQEAADAPIDYSTYYFHANGKVGHSGFFLLSGYELLGSDDGKAAFKTPLATLHAFNGWSDQFLVTPKNGLQDYYAGFIVPVPKVPLTFIYHYFTSDEDSISYGQEIDALATHNITKQLSTIAKASYYDADEYSVDTTRFSLELNYKF